MKKVLFLIPTLGHGGAEKVLVNLVNNMDKSRYDVTVMCLFDVGVNRQFLSNDVKYRYAFKRIIRGNSKILSIFSPEFLYRKLIKDRYDVIVSYLEGVTARIASGCPYEETKLVSWIHCKIDSKEVAAAGFRNYEEAKDCYNRFDNTVCVSKMTQEYFTNTLSFDKPSEVLYNTIESEQIRELSMKDVDDVEFSQDCFNICSVGKITKVKGFERLAAIHKRLLEVGIKNKVYILGVGDEQEKIEEYLSENNLKDTFIFLGYRVNPYKYVRSCDLYVCSSYSEGFSTAVTEALITGTPVVTTFCSGMQEQLGYNNEYGIVTENDEESLYQGVKKILTEKGLLEHYAEMSAQRGKRFDKKVTVKAVEDMLERI